MAQTDKGTFRLLPSSMPRAIPVGLNFVFVSAQRSATRESRHHCNDVDGAFVLAATGSRVKIDYVSRIRVRIRESSSECWFIVSNRWITLRSREWILCFLMH